MKQPSGELANRTENQRAVKSPGPLILKGVNRLLGGWIKVSYLQDDSSQYQWICKSDDL